MPLLSAEKIEQVYDAFTKLDLSLNEIAAKLHMQKDHVIIYLATAFKKYKTPYLRLKKEQTNSILKTHKL